MQEEGNPKKPASETQHQERLAEISYHRRMNRWLGLLGAVIFAAFALFHGFRQNLFQAVIYALLFTNVTVSIIVGLRIQNLDQLVLLKRATGGLGFTLLAISLLTGLLSDDVYLFLPWSLTYPVAVSLFFGKRIGVYAAAVFTLIATVAICNADLPPLNDSAASLLRSNAALALLTITNMSLIGEKFRISVQRDLVASQENHKQSELRYRSLFEESAVSLWEENWSQLKAHLDQLPRTAAQDLMAHFNTHPEQVAVCAGKMEVTAVNRATLQLLQADTADALLANLDRLMPPEARHEYMSARIAGLCQNGRFHAEVDVQTLAGEPRRHLVITAIPAGFEATWARVFTSVYDMTERVAMEKEKKRVERQLNDARQMQAIATLAGGIAHQFNNALSAIYGNVELLKMASFAAETVKITQSLRTAADRMSMLTDQLLAYARGGKYLPKIFSINELIGEIVAHYRVKLPSTLSVTTDLSRDIFSTSGDITQIGMVIEAVLSNAVEAMQETGVLSISTRNLRVPHDRRTASTDLPPGDFAHIEIRDTGTGMDEQTRRRIFEPFFTTKFFGRGLGMAAAYGIIQNHAGSITVESVPGQGTRVHIYLPGNRDIGQ